MPATRHTPQQIPFISKCISQKTDHAARGPDPNKPYFKQRPILPIPPENTQVPGAIDAAGIPPGVLAHNHSPTIVACDNGDLLAVYYSACTSSTESWPNIAFVGVRLRFGTEQWDMPELIVDFPDLNEYHMLLWNDNGTIRMFTGAIGLERMPFEWCSSADNGATWSEFEFPKMVGPLGPFDAKPISTAFRDADNTMYMSTDGTGNISLLIASDDNGKTWYDTGGRTHGRHTVFVPRKDNSIFGMGGKKSDIDGYMPSSISYDKGKTWTKGKTPFAALGSNQRPSLVKLQSGRYFFAGDFQTSFKGLQPQGIRQRGAYAALSDDEGKTWHIKKLNAAVPHEGASVPRPPYKHRPDWHIHPHKSGSVGYSVATQSPNGMIHLISSMNHPNLHFEMNEAWILSDSDAVTIGDPAGKIESFEEKYTGDKIKAKYSAKITEDGRYLRHGEHKWYYDTGQLQWHVHYKDGTKIGEGKHFAPDGKLKAKWTHNADGTSTWQQYWANGNLKSQSIWKDHRAQGAATTYSPSGEIVRQIEFDNGISAKD